MQELGRRALTLTVSVMLVTACSSGSGSEGDGSGTHPSGRPEPDPVRLEPLDSVLPDPFVPQSMDAIDRVADALAHATESGALGERLAEPPELSRQVGTELAGQEAAGSEPGLYGGSRDAASCDLDGLEEFLTDDANAGEAEAWADVLDIEAEDISDYLGGLTPVRLRLDTRVTNHSYVDGAAGPVQSLLQAGTAVLVDDRGVPRVLCSCGNPLIEPERLASGRDEQSALELDEVAANPSDAWDGLEPGSVVAVTVEVAIDVVVVYDIDTGELFERPVGTDGSRDRPYEPPGSPSTTSSTTTTTTTTEPPPPPTLPPVPAAAEVGDCVELDVAFTRVVAIGGCGAGTSATYRVVDVVDIFGSCPSSNQPYLSSGDFLLCLELQIHEGYCYQFYDFPDGSHVVAADCGTSGVWHVLAVIPGATLDQAEAVCPSDLAWTVAQEVDPPLMLLCTAGT